MEFSVERVVIDRSIDRQIGWDRIDWPLSVDRWATMKQLYKFTF